MTLQAGRYLVGCYREAKAGKKQAGGVAYLNNLSQFLSLKSKARSQAQVMSLDVIGEAYNVVSGNVVKKAGDDFEACLAKGLREDEAYEECCKFFELIRKAQVRLYAAKMHSFGYLFHRFKDALAKTPAPLLPVLTRLCQLYGLYNILENSGAFLQYQYFNSDQVFFEGKTLTEQMDWIRSSVSDLCKQLREDAVPLTDSFAYSDYMINSPLGRYSGDMYVFLVKQEIDDLAMKPTFQWCNPRILLRKSLLISRMRYVSGKCHSITRFLRCSIIYQKKSRYWNWTMTMTKHDFKTLKIHKTVSYFLVEARPFSGSTKSTDALPKPRRGAPLNPRPRDTKACFWT